MHATLYYGNVEEKVWLICKYCENRIYRLQDCLDVSGYDYWNWKNYKQGDAVKWYPKKEPTLLNRELNQVWNLESICNSDSFYLKDYKNNFYLCYGYNKTMFLSNNASDKK